MENQFARTEKILGAESTDILRNKRVVIFGLGGVGGYVTEALSRSGIGTLDIVDGDTVDITNLNRQIIATHETIGRPKTDVFEERIHSICPDTVVNKYQDFYLPESLERDFDFSAYDYVVDAIDTVAAKVALVEMADKAEVPIISAMGCGNRMDPSSLIETDIFKTEYDPLAKVMRKKLKELGIKKLKVVYSTEPAIKPAVESKEGRTPGSSPFVPAAAGLLIASIVVRDILDL